MNRPFRLVAGRLVAGLAVALAAMAGCTTDPAHLVTSQASYGYNLPVSVPVEPEGFDEPDSPILNADGGEIPKGVYTAPVETSGLGDPRVERSN